MRHAEIGALQLEQWEINYAQAQREEETAENTPLPNIQSPSTNKNIAQIYAVTVARGSDFSAKVTRTVAENGVLGIQDLVQKLLGENDNLTFRFATEAQIRGFAHTAPFLSEEMNETGEPTIKIAPDAARAVSQEIELAKKDAGRSIDVTDNQLSARELEIFTRRMPPPPSITRLIVDNLLGKDPHPREFHPDDAVVNALRGISETGSKAISFRETATVTETTGKQAEEAKDNESDRLPFYD